MKLVLFIVLIVVSLLSGSVFSQNLGGSYTYSFLKLAPTASSTALGGNVVAQLSPTTNTTVQNPALLSSSQYKQLLFSYQNINGGGSHMQASYTFELPKYEIPFQTGVQFVNYGSIANTDASGVVLGNLSVNDYVVYGAISTPYNQRWHVGATLKFIGSNYGTQSSYAIAADIGTTYTDTSNGFQIGMLVKKYGNTIKTLHSQTTRALAVRFANRYM